MTAAAPNTLDELAAALRTADDRRLVAVVALLDRLPARAAAEELLESVRPRLWSLRPPRRLSLRRVLSVPLEPLLAEPALAPPGGVRLPRSLLPAVFALVEAELPPRVHEAAAARCAVLSTAAVEGVIALGATLWPQAADALHHAFLDPRGMNRWLSERAIDPAPLNEHFTRVLTLLRHGEALAGALLQREGRGLDQAGGAAPLRAMLFAAAEADALQFRCIAAAFLLRASAPDQVVRLVAQARLMFPKLAAFDVLEEVVASLGQELAALPPKPAQTPSALAERRSRAALRLAMILGELTGQGSRIELLAAEAGAGLARQFAATLDAAVLAPLTRLAAAERADSASLAGIEAAARAAKRMEMAGRVMGRAGAFAAALAGARMRIAALARGAAITAAGAAGAVALPDLVRLVEILAGPDAALDMVERLAAEG